MLFRRHLAFSSSGLKMLWKDIIYQIIMRGVVEHAAIISPKGEILACSPDMSVSKRDIKHVLHGLNDGCNTLMKLELWETYYTCFRENSDTFVGMAENSLLVAHRSKDCLIIGLSDPKSPGSCLYEVTKFGKHIMKGTS